MSIVEWKHPQGICTSTLILTQLFAFKLDVTLMPSLSFPCNAATEGKMRAN